MNVGIVGHMFERIFLDFLVLMHVHGVKVVFLGRFFNLNQNDYEFGLDVSKNYLFIYIYSILVSSNVNYGYILLRYLFY
jgi:hypothetical protein